MQPEQRPGLPIRFFKPGNYTVRMLPPVQGTAVDLRQHYVPAGNSKATFACKGGSCPACAAGVKLERRVNVPLQGGAGHLSMAVDKYRALEKQIAFGQMYGLSGTSLRKRLDLGHLKRAPVRKRPKRIAKKIAKRGGWMTCVDLFFASDTSDEKSFTAVWASTNRSIRDQRRLAFDNRPDVVEMRELMLADGVPRRERQRAYRALRRLTPVTFGELAAVEGLR